MRFLTVGVMSIGLFAASAAAATAGTDSIGRMDRPIVGYVAQSSTPELRAIIGVPGAAVLSDPLPLPSNVRRIYMPPGQSYALLRRIDQDPAVLLLNSGSADQVIPVLGAISTPDVVSFSPYGRAAVIFSESAGRLEVITGLPQAPIVAQVFDAALLPDLPRTLAVSDDGRYVMASSSTAVYWISWDGSTHIIANVTGVASLTFLPEYPGAAIGDRTTGSVYVVEDSVTGPTTKLIATGLSGLGDISPAARGGILYITKPSANCIWSVRVSTGEVVLYEVGVSPLTIDRLRNTDTFLIASELGEPVWMFLRQGNDAITVFVPVATHPQDRAVKPFRQ